MYLLVRAEDRLLIENMREKFRFEHLEIWQESIELADKRFDIADELENKHLYRFAEQLTGARLSISNNIAEGSGSSFKKDFANFLNIARRSLYEVVNIIIVLHRGKIIDIEMQERHLVELDQLSRKMTNFRKSLLN